MKPMREYLGDSVYAEFDGYEIKLALNNGLDDHTVIVLEPEVIARMNAFIKRAQDAQRIELEMLNHF
jgi:hypothetical protein